MVVGQTRLTLPLLKSSLKEQYPVMGYCSFLHINFLYSIPFIQKEDAAVGRLGVLT